MTPTLRAITALDMNQLHSNIFTSLRSDPLSLKHLDDQSNLKWSIDNNGLLWLSNRIYVPDFNNLDLRVLEYHHNHPISGHFGQNQTLGLVQQDYVWPKMREYIQHHLNSCTTCMRSKSQRHKPYRPLKQLLVLEQPWNSISMDFIEKIPPSVRFDTILVIVDHFTKQSLFIPMYNTITSVMLAKLFIPHVFSKHGVPLPPSC
jgi:Integrase zinc binding domain